MNLTLKLTRLAAVLVVICLASSQAHASGVTWTINSTASNFTLKIPDSSISLSGLAINIRVRNQNGATWTTNSIKLKGTVNTDYNEVLQQRISFLGGQTNMVGIDSGNYRPNPASWNLTVANGSFQNTSTSPGAFAGLIRFNTLLLFNFDVALFKIFDVLFDAQSNFLPFVMNGAVNLQTNGGLDIGIGSGKIAADGGQIGPVPGVLPDPILIPDANTSALGSQLGNNQAFAGTITNMGGLNRRLVIPIVQNSSIDLSGAGGTFLITQGTGQLVLDAVVPEPATLMLAGLGLVSFVLCAKRRFAKR